MVEEKINELISSENTNETPLIISGMYRSGTSFIWRMLTEDPHYHNYYYEPLHPKLTKEIETNPIFKEYKDNSEILKKWSPEFDINHFFLEKNQNYLDLKIYLNELIKPGALIKFTRTTLRLDWLLNNYNSAKVINIVRDPRSVCYSYMERRGIPFQKKNIFKDFFKEYENVKSFKEGSEAIFNFLKKKYLEFNAEHRKPSVYSHLEYLKSLENIDHWKNYASYLLENDTMVKILGLWRINVEQSENDIESYQQRAITIRHEDLCRFPEKTIKTIYSFLDRKVPTEIINSINEKKVNEKFKMDHHKFHSPVTTKWLERWKKVDNDIWIDSLEKAKVIPLMKKIGYSLDT